MDLLLSIVGILVVFGAVIFVHEFGHFFVAKKSGIKVEQFSFGFGPEIFGFTWGETRYTVNWIPLGGYVRMAGEVQEDYEGPVLEGKTEKADNAEPVDHSRDFMAQSWYRRVLVALAGPVMNYVFATAIFFMLFLVWGERQQINPTEVGEVIAGMPAEKAGLRSGDSITHIEGEAVEDFGSIAGIIAKRSNQETELSVVREDQSFQLVVTPALNEKEGRGLIGIRPAAPIVEHQKIGIGKAFTTSLKQCYFISALTLGHL